ncbi:hypothetical protein GCM10027445_57770 [Amycolatopsis endophytica]|uniref:methenyltetrahydrofolate cyclohydrolase n=1 Tax=Amycolatopsis endophytica TaxID=860233 RepID=A0A853B349_9PSEU|nr:5,10-methylene-tetrahydrofolate dehydrogenase/methenyl tetrahydrofolate cyclohydrolase [Amycolatopsis endophytica]
MLATVLVGDDPASRSVELPETTTTAEPVARVGELSADPEVDGILLARDATVTYCHSKTRELAEVVREADVVVAAIGRPELVRGEWIKPGAVVADAGYHPGGVGDVEFAAAAERAAAITPVPGGVGPMTIAVLLARTVDAVAATIE